MPGGVVVEVHELAAPVTAQVTGPVGAPTASVPTTSAVNVSESPTCATAGEAGAAQTSIDGV